MQGFAIVFVIAIVTAALSAVIVMSEFDLAVIRAWHTLIDRPNVSVRTTDWTSPAEAPSDRPVPEPAVEYETLRTEVVQFREHRAGETAMSLRDALEMRRAQVRQGGDSAAA